MTDCARIAHPRPWTNLEDQGTTRSVELKTRK
jgi:hypothetical protein